MQRQLHLLGTAAMPMVFGQTISALAIGRQPITPAMSLQTHIFLPTPLLTILLHQHCKQGTTQISRALLTMATFLRLRFCSTSRMQTTDLTFLARAILQSNQAASLSI